MTIPKEIWIAAGIKNTTINTKTGNVDDNKYNKSRSKPSAQENKRDTQLLPYIEPKAEKSKATVQDLELLCIVSKVQNQSSKMLGSDSI